MNDDLPQTGSDRVIDAGRLRRYPAAVGVSDHGYVHRGIPGRRDLQTAVHDRGVIVRNVSLRGRQLGVAPRRVITISWRFAIGRRLG